MPGRIMAGEIAEQPAVLRRLLEEGAPRIRRTAEEIAARGPRFVPLTARGSSDNAALYATYPAEVALGEPAGLTPMSTSAAYGARPDLRDCLVVTVSQSGGSPDLAASTRAARGRCDHPCGHRQRRLAAGGGLRVPHRRPGRSGEGASGDGTYTAELLALHLFVEGLPGGDGGAAMVLPELAEQVLARQDEVRALAARHRFAERLALTSGGHGYPTAKEAALKLRGTSYIPALSFSGADLLHGPPAMVDHVFPVIAIVTEGKGGEALRPVLDRLRGRGADLVVIGDRASADAASAGFVLPPRASPRRCGRSWRSRRCGCRPPRSPSSAARIRTRRAPWGR